MFGLGKNCRVWQSWACSAAKENHRNSSLYNVIINKYIYPCSRYYIHVFNKGVTNKIVQISCIDKVRIKVAMSAIPGSSGTVDLGCCLFRNCASNDNTKLDKSLDGFSQGLFPCLASRSYYTTSSTAKKSATIWKLPNAKIERRS